MKEKLLLVGAGGFGRVVLEHASGLYDCAFLDDGDVKIVDGIPVLGKISAIKEFYPQYKFLLVAIGNNVLREKVYCEAEKIGYTFPNIIHPSAYISPHAHIGVGNVILNNVVIQNNAKMGNGCILNPGVELHHDSVIGSNVLIYTNSVIRSLTVVEDRVWIGSNVTVSTSAFVAADSKAEDGVVIRAKE